jgi:hypothetical protein
MAIATPTVTRLQDQHDVNVTPAAGVDLRAVLWDNSSGKFVLGGSQINIGAITIDTYTEGSKNYCVNAANNTIESGTNTNTIAGGGNNPGANLIGSPNGLPEYSTYIPLPTGWAEDTDYVAGSAIVSTIGGGYDNIVNQIAGTICGGGHNFMRYSVHGHSVIGGGSFNVVQSGRSGIFSGTANTITDKDKVFSVILGGTENNIVGSRSGIFGGANNNITGSYSFAFGRLATITADGCVAIADGSGTGVTVGTANVFGSFFTGGYRLGGGDVVIGATAAAAATKLEIVNPTTNQLRLSYTAGSVYSNIYTDSSGYLQISATGGRAVLNSTILRVAEIWDNGANLTLTTSGASRNVILKTNDATGNIQIQPINSGFVGIGTDSPASRLHVVQNSTTKAVPVLTLTQTDVSEEFVRFIGTSTTDASQSLVDAANMTTPGAIAGWVKVYVQDDQGTNSITDGVYFVPFYTAPTA